MKNHKNILKMMIGASLICAPLAAQSFGGMEQVQAEIQRAKKALKAVDMEKVQRDIERAQEAMKSIDWNDLSFQLKSAGPAFDFDFQDLLAQVAPVAPAAPWPPLPPAPALVPPMAPPAMAPMAPLAPAAPFAMRGIGAGIGFAFAPQTQAERAQEQAERQREAAERAREAKERGRESEERSMEYYRSGTNSVDEHRYERAIEYFDRVINAKWSRADGAYYWKAYALNKLGKRDEAVAALGEISKQFPQSRWINDAKALQVEIQQASGQPVSPENMSDEDLKILAMNSFVNAEPEKAVPILEKVLNDPKNNLSVKGRALYVLAQSRSDKAREIVGAYAKSGANQDLQIRAVGYIGSFRMTNSAQILSDVYSSTNDVAVRRAVLRAMSNARDAAHLLTAAKTEQNQDLRREAIRGLGNMQASIELAQLYPTETNAELKEAIIDSIANSRNLDKLVDIAKGEKDTNVRAHAIRRLGTMRGGPGGEKAGESLVVIYKAEPDKTVKTNILRALAQNGACPQLVEVIRSEKDTDIRASGVRYLGQMKSCKEATDLLEEIIAK